MPRPRVPIVCQRGAKRGYKICPDNFNSDGGEKGARRGVKGGDGRRRERKVGEISARAPGESINVTYRA